MEERRLFVRSWRGAVKRCSTWGRIAARWSDAAVRMASGLTLRAHRGGGRRGASCGLGSRAIFGCSFRTSVAEVGETHLPSVIKVSREAIQEGAGSGRRGGSSWTRRAGARCSKGCGARTRERTGIADAPGPAARVDINPKEGALGRLYRRLKQAAVAHVLARRMARRGLHRKVRRAASSEGRRWSSCVSAVVRQRVSEVTSSRSGSLSRRAQRVCSQREARRDAPRMLRRTSEG